MSSRFFQAFVAGTVMATAFSAPAAVAAQQSGAAVRSENAAVTAAAKGFYAQLVTGKVDRSKLSLELNQALPDSTLGLLSGQLKTLGSPTWQYLAQVQGPEGPSSLYKLSYSSVSLYMAFGVSSAGTIYSFFLGNQRPPNT